MANRRSRSPLKSAQAVLILAAVSLPVYIARGGELSPQCDLPEAPRAAPTRCLAAVPYAKVENDEVLRLDVFDAIGADDEGPRPLIIFIHGGGWMTGFRWDIPKELIHFVQRGFVVASIDYRSSRGNGFLSNVQDVKAAIRFLRANAVPLRIDADRIALVGFASGGHLAALAGLAGSDLEGTVGEHDDTSSATHAIISFQGPMNLRTILVQKTVTGTGKHRVPVELLLGGAPEHRETLAIKASPIGHVRPGAPPLLLVYGGADDQVPAAQGREMAAAYHKQGAIAELHVIEEAEHKSLLRFDDQRERLLASFLERRLLPPD